jgi:hypothetical protein
VAQLAGGGEAAIGDHSVDLEPILCGRSDKAGRRFETIELMRAGELEELRAIALEFLTEVGAPLGAIASARAPLCPRMTRHRRHVTPMRKPNPSAMATVANGRS